MPELVTRSAYARLRGISRQAVCERTRPGGPIPTHGPRHLIDVEEADRLWFATMTTARVLGGQSRAQIPRTAAPASKPAAASPAAVGDQFARAQLATLVVQVQRDRLELEERKASLVDVAATIRAVRAHLAFVNRAWAAWPAKAAAALGAELGVDPERLRQALERHVREHLADLSKQPLPELKPG